MKMCLDSIIKLEIFIAYHKNSHCFVHGSGIETFAYWVNQTSKVLIDPKMLRRYMIKLVSQGYFKIYKSSSNYTCFDLKNKGKVTLEKLKECYAKYGRFL